MIKMTNKNSVTHISWKNLVQLLNQEGIVAVIKTEVLDQLRLVFRALSSVFPLDVEVFQDNEEIFDSLFDD